MNSRTALFLILLASLVAFASDGPDQSSNQCGEIVRFDLAQSRLFVVCPSLPNMSQDSMIRAIEDIEERFDGPSVEMYISFFSTKDMAGYKDDPCCEVVHESNEWAESYVGEYYTHSGKMVIWPALPSKQRILRL